MDTVRIKKYEDIAKEARKTVLSLIFKAQTSHIGSNFSAIDIMAVLFEKADPQKDEVVLSAGWKAAAWYYFLWRKGIITEEELNSFCQTIKVICKYCKGAKRDFIGQLGFKQKIGCNFCNSRGFNWEQSKFIGLIEPMERWGLRIAGGSMCLGIAGAVGLALAKKLKGEEGKVYCLCSDGEMQGGMIWESALIASQFKLNNLIVIVDVNGFQAMGKTNEILSIEPLMEKFMSFNWKSVEIEDGNDCNLVKETLETDWIDLYDVYGIRQNDVREKPLIIFAKTIKGKGVSFMENNNLYHYKQLSTEEYNKALQELI